MKWGVFITMALLLAIAVNAIPNPEDLVNQVPENVEPMRVPENLEPMKIPDDVIAASFADTKKPIGESGEIIEEGGKIFLGFVVLGLGAVVLAGGTYLFLKKVSEN